MVYKLYCTGASGNSYKVALYLNCAGLDWEPVGVDFAGGQMRDPSWRASTNEMGEVPVLEVDDRNLSQSGAILTWLAETTGHFAPADDQRFEALRWILFDNHKFTGSYAPHRFLNVCTAEPGHPSLMAYLADRVDNAFGIVDRHLALQPFMLGERPTIVDFSLAGYVFYPAAETGFDIATRFPAIDAWRGRLAGLPGWRPPYELMNVGSSLMLRAPVVVPDAA
ncbi:MAG: glutathione S-transferase C-terminal domain-containing protein [Reyranella sp.]|nr:glutathione S-transferase C-terminal domain-containing protein [Reyranella sp.]MBL6651560.1 glutathione S-transferase C-terminal domain-containing protein [Reyranella sp.]